MISAFPIEERERKKCGLAVASPFKMILQGQQVSSIPETHSASFCVCTASCASTGRNPKNMCKYIVGYFHCMQITRRKKQNGPYKDLVNVLHLYTFYPYFLKDTRTSPPPPPPFKRVTFQLSPRYRLIGMAGYRLWMADTLLF